MYRAHHLGVHEIGETECSDEAHAAMTFMKESVVDWEKISRVTLDLTCNGITIFDETFKVSKKMKVGTVREKNNKKSFLSEERVLVTFMARSSFKKHVLDTCR